MLVSKLEVVNGCIGTMGETPLNTLEDDHAYKAAALSYLNIATLNEQKAGYWYNSEYVHLVPDATSGFIYVPQDAVAIKPIKDFSPSFAQRGKRLYNIAHNSYVWEHPVVVDVVRALDFDDLPFHAADCVRWSAIMQFQLDYDGDTVRYNQIGQKYGQSKVELHAEDVRNKRPNLLLTQSNQIKMARISPMTRYEPFLGIR